MAELLEQCSGTAKAVQTIEHKHTVFLSLSAVAAGSNRHSLRTTAATLAIFTKFKSQNGFDAL